MGSTRPLTPQHRTMHRSRGPPEAQTPDPRTLSPPPAPPSLDRRKVYTRAGRRSRCAMCLRRGTPHARTTRRVGNRSVHVDDTPQTTHHAAQQGQSTRTLLRATRIAQDDTFIPAPPVALVWLGRRCPQRESAYMEAASRWAVAHTPHMDHLEGAHGMLLRTPSRHSRAGAQSDHARWAVRGCGRSRARRL